MSFPRAKIKRFNEVPTVTPSPAEYNVNFKQNPILGTISQSDRFTEPKSPPLSETGSTQSTPCFRTPTLLKKKKLILGFESKLKIQNLKLTDRELLNEKTVECKNKDTFIKELTEQFEEFKNKIYDLNCKKESLDKQKKKLEEEISELRKVSKEEIEHISKGQEVEIVKLNETILELRKKIEILNKEIDNLKEHMEKLENDKKHEIELHTEEIDLKNELIESLKLNLKQKEEEKDGILKEHENKLEQMCVKHEEELQNIEFEMLKCVHDAQKSLEEEKLQNQLKIKQLQKCLEHEIETIKQSFTKEKELINSQNIARINQLEENMSEMKVLSEIQSKEKCTELENYWRNKLEKQEQESSEILKECQAISEYSIIQSELEKNEYKAKYDSNTKKYNELERKYDNVYFNYKQLQASYSNVQNKLYRLIKELREKEGLKNDINKLMTEKQTYQTTILRSQETIDILKRRLRESDQDVEQLKNEISENENKLLEYECKFNILSEELREAQDFNDELEMRNESTIKITQEEIRNIQEDLLKKVEDFKMKAEENQKIHREELKKKELEKEELMKIIAEQQMLNQNASALIEKTNMELERLTCENSDFSYQVEILNRENAVLQSSHDSFNEQKDSWSIEKKEMDLKIDILRNEVNRLRKVETDLKNSSETMGDMKKMRGDLEKESLGKDTRICQLQEEIQKIKKKYMELEKTNAKHVKMIEDQEALIAPFKEQLEAYEMEMNNLQSAKNHMENEAKDLGIKYAQILGHQNHKQKIKYMVNLKTKNEDLMKSNLDLEAKFRSQDKKMEKLRKENAELKRNLRKQSIFEDKENIASPNRSFKCESPGPLREIN